MECLAAGRSISLPALSTGGGKLVSPRRPAPMPGCASQFKLPIGQFEGVEEALARIAGHTYLMDAARTMTCGAVDQGERPSVISAIVKYQCTERRRSSTTAWTSWAAAASASARATSGPHLPGHAHQHHGGGQHPHPTLIIFGRA